MANDLEPVGDILKGEGFQISPAQRSWPQTGELRPTRTQECPICKGAGFLRKNLAPDHPDFGKAIPCQCTIAELEQTRAERLFRFCELPDGSRRFTFDTFEIRPGVKTAYKVARAMAEGRNDFRWLTLTGGVGCGKTHLGIAIILERLKMGRMAKYIYVPDLLDSLRDALDPEAEVRYSDLLRRYEEVELLFLDDLGTESPTAWVNEKVDQLVDYRYRNGMELIVATNLKGKALLPRVVDRLRDYRLGRVITITAPSYRKEQNED